MAVKKDMKQQKVTAQVHLTNVQNSRGTLRIFYLLGILVALMIIDAVISQFSVRSGAGFELNPLLKSIISEQIFIPIKVFHAMVCAFILWNIYRRMPKFAFRAISLSVFIYTGIVVWNMATFLSSLVAS